ncbi:MULTISPECIES: hypothetical protein [Lutispora]|uniref:Uncharacterized protein n=1 Tax=Lutispora saccharofermentans TaxID=3024236 RepID=A0ABT1NFB6_9FIRM|nr:MULTISPECIES: hypothetical protein [Lutispora]MCQ1529041.1 hypothetical protein [Lutispora saccharofermentans]MEA4963075.1 hypothetical protein [Lutispora sp.]
MKENIFYGNNVNMIKREEDCTVYRMKDLAGEGILTLYKVFPGIDLMYNDFHMQSCFSKLFMGPPSMHTCVPTVCMLRL